MTPHDRTMAEAKGPYLTPDQACDDLQISMSTLRRLIAGEELKAYRLGHLRTRRFLIEDLDRLLTPEQVSSDKDDITDYILGRVGRTFSHSRDHQKQGDLMISVHTSTPVWLSPSRHPEP